MRTACASEVERVSGWGRWWWGRRGGGTALYGKVRNGKHSGRVQAKRVPDIAEEKKCGSSTTPCRLHDLHIPIDISSQHRAPSPHQTPCSPLSPNHCSDLIWRLPTFIHTVYVSCSSKDCVPLLLSRPSSQKAQLFSLCCFSRLSRAFRGSIPPAACMHRSECGVFF